ncbi:MAG: DUF2508 family protein [Faecalibacterium sp.]|jgi:hypothetical protein|nr:DUF2508 family protein [Faecalibacterium sp.]
MLTAVKRRNLPQTKPDHDPELDKYHPGLEEELRECLADMRHNEMMFNLETEPDLVEQRIYERQALRCRYRYLMERAKKTGLRTILRANVEDV